MAAGEHFAGGFPAVKCLSGPPFRFSPDFQDVPPATDSGCHNKRTTAHYSADFGDLEIRRCDGCIARRALPIPFAIAPQSSVE
jgi:hypothetical protein